MPSVDPETGQRLSGAAQRRRARAASGGARPAQDVGEESERSAGPNPLANIEPPPVPAQSEHLVASVGACESWAASVAVRCASCPDLDPETELGARVRLIRDLVRKVGQLRDKATRCCKAVELLRLRRGELHVVTQEEPPRTPVAACAWAFFRLCVLTHAACTERSLTVLAEYAATLAAVGFVPGKGAIDALIRELTPES